MNSPARRDGGAVLRRSSGSASRHLQQPITTAVWGPDKVRGVRLKDGTTIDCDLVVVAAGIRPNTEVAVASGFTVERAIVVDDQMRTVDDDDVYAVGECAQHRGQVYGLVAPLWEQAKVLADQITGANPDAATLGSRPRPSSRWPASRWPRWASPGRRRTPTSTSSSPSRKRHLQVGGHPRRPARRRHPARRQQQGRLPAAGVRPRPAAARGAGRAAVRPRRPAGRGRGRELADDAQVCNCNGVSKGHLVVRRRRLQAPWPR